MNEPWSAVSAELLLDLLARVRAGDRRVLEELRQGGSAASFAQLEQRLLLLADTFVDGKPRSRVAVLERVREEADNADLVELLDALARRAEREPLSKDLGSVDATPRTWGRLELLEQVGRGAFGTVYRARDPQLDRIVALKLIRTENLAEQARIVAREGRLLARIRHPNVATVHGVEQEGIYTGIWMEFLEGRTLADLVQEQGPLGAREASLIGVDVCRALAAVHARGIVHRDVKAQNVIRETGGRIVLTDFGIGLDLHEDASVQWTISGTPRYMAPEIFDSRAASTKSDIYSVGVLLFYLATGTFPVSGRSMREVRQAHQEGRSRLLRDVRPDLPEAFVRAVEWSLERDPEKRAPSVGALERALLDVLAVEPTTAPLPPGRPPGRWRPALAALLAGALLVAGGAIYRHRTPPAVPEPAARVVVAEFRNETREKLFDSTVRSLFGLALAQSPRLYVLPDAQILEALKRMEKPSGSRLDAETARELCVRENIPVMVAGEVLERKGRYEVVARALNPLTGSLLAERSLSLADSGDLVGRVDDLAADLRQALGDSPDLIVQNRRRLEEVTTASLDALQHFTEALYLHSEGEIELAIRKLESAVQSDPQFALAYNRLAIYRGGIGNYEGAFDAVQKAFNLRDRVSQRERLQISATYHLDCLQYEEALKDFQSAALLDPQDSGLHRQIAQIRISLGEAGAGVEAARTARDLPPPSLINHGVLIMALAMARRPGDAWRELQAARARFGPQPYLAWSEGLTHLVQGDLPAAEKAFGRLVAAGGTYASYGRILLAQVLMLQGRLHEAAAQLESGVGLDQRKGFERNGGIRSILLAKVYRLLGSRDQALRQLDPIGALADLPLYLKVFRGAALVSIELGDLGRARRWLRRIESLRDRYPSDLSRGAAAQVRGEIARAEGRLDQARSDLEAARLSWDDPSTLRSLAGFWIERGHCDKALPLLDAFLSTEEGRGWGDFSTPWIDLLNARREAERCRLALRAPLITS